MLISGRCADLSQSCPVVKMGASFHGNEQDQLLSYLQENCVSRSNQATRSLSSPSFSVSVVVSV